jgi:hypothetical protein
MSVMSHIESHSFVSIHTSKHLDDIILIFMSR